MIVLLFGLIFLIEYLDSKGAPLISSLIGYVSVAVIYFISVYLRKSNPDLYLRFGVTGLILAFYVTLRLHFFTDKPLIASNILGILLLLAVAAYSVFISFRREIRSYATLAVIYLFTTAVVSDNTHIMLILAAAASFLSVLYFQSIDK